MSLRSLNDAAYDSIIRKWSQVIRQLYRWRYADRMDAAMANMEESRNNILKDFESEKRTNPLNPHPENFAVGNFLRTFRFQGELWPFYDWWLEQQDDEMVIYWLRGQKGDCDDAAYSAQWAWKVLGIESDIVTLGGKWLWNARHAVCVRRDNNVMASNGTLSRFDAAAALYGRAQAILGLFGGKYRTVTGLTEGASDEKA
jgi:hypothetical protein